MTGRPIVPNIVVTWTAREPWSLPMHVRMMGRPFKRVGALLLVGAPAFAQGTTERVSVDSSGAEGNGDSGAYDPNHWGNLGMAISADSSCVVFSSRASNLVAGDTNGVGDIFLHDRTTGITERVSVDSSGAEANGESTFPAVSADGRFVVFTSAASNLVTSDTNGKLDVFLRDRVTGVTERISVDSSGAEANEASGAASVNEDGSFAAFSSTASNLVAGDTNGTSDVFLRDRIAGVTSRVSIDSAGMQASGASYAPSLSADGSIVAFESVANNLVAGDTNAASDVFVRDVIANTTVRVSVDSSGVQGNDDSRSSAVSADGLVVGFSSNASNLFTGDSNYVGDIFVHEMVSGVTECISLAMNGNPGDMQSYAPSLSQDGRYVVFESWATNLVPGDTNWAFDAFVRDRVATTTERASIDSSDAQGNSYSFYPRISADGQIVAFDSWCTNLVANDTNGNADVFVHVLREVRAAWTSYGSGTPGTFGVPAFTVPQGPVLGGTIAFDLANSLGANTVGLLFVGFQQTSIHSSLGGDLLVVPNWTTVTAVPAVGATFSNFFPDDPHLYGFELFLQAFELDAGAAKGVSFTQGLDVIFGGA